jgi:hypothetical protein
VTTCHLSSETNLVRVVRPVWLKTCRVCMGVHDGAAAVMSTQGEL